MHLKLSQITHQIDDEITRSIGHIKIPKLDNQLFANNGLFNDVLHRIADADKLANKTQMTIETEHDFSSISKQQTNVKFMPEEISSTIFTDIVATRVYKTHIGQRDIRIIISIYETLNDKIEHEIATKAKQIITWLHFIDHYANNECGKITTIYIYLTEYDKTIPHHSHDPTQILVPDNINSAYTTTCTAKGSIVIFREEEWFKILLHETNHLYDIDCSSFDTNIVANDLYNMFPIRSEFLIGETYAEFWANTFNSCFAAFWTTNSHSDAIKTTRKRIDAERRFALYQANKILAHMGLTYNHLIGKTGNDLQMRKLFHETTNGFTYYILKSILMLYYNEFVAWCNTHCQKNVVFTKTNNTYKQYVQFFKTYYATTELIDTYSQIHAILPKTTHMNIWRTMKMVSAEYD